MFIVLFFLLICLGNLGFWELGISLWIWHLFQDRTCIFTLMPPKQSPSKNPHILGLCRHFLSKFQPKYDRFFDRMVFFIPKLSPFQNKNPHKAHKYRLCEDFTLFELFLRFLSTTHKCWYFLHFKHFYFAKYRSFRIVYKIFSSKLVAVSAPIIFHRLDIIYFFITHNE